MEPEPEPHDTTVMDKECKTLGRGRFFARSAVPPAAPDFYIDLTAAAIFAFNDRRKRSDGCHDRFNQMRINTS